MDHKRSTEKYEAYLRTDKWRRKAAARLKIDHYACAMCGCRGTTRNRLQVHHLCYSHIYNENIFKDLVTVCETCHSGIHRLMNRTVGFSETGQPIHGWKDTLPPSTVAANIGGQTYFIEDIP